MESPHKPQKPTCVCVCACARCVCACVTDTHVLWGQELHAFGHLITESHEISVAQNRRITDDQSPIHPVTCDKHTLIWSDYKHKIHAVPWYFFFIIKFW